MDPYVYTYTTPELASGIWYVRVKAAEEEGLTEPSQVVSFTLGVSTSVEDIMHDTTTSKSLENGQVVIYRNGKKYNLLGNHAQ